MTSNFNPGPPQLCEYPNCLEEWLVTVNGKRLCLDHGYEYEQARPKPDQGPFVTKTGRVLTEGDIEALADEAERGYDVEHLRDKPLRERLTQLRNVVENIQPEPTQLTTYRRADGQLIQDYSFVTDKDYLDAEMAYGFDPVEYVEETWECVRARRIIVFPQAFSCSIPVGDGTCEEDASGWVRLDSGWFAACPNHGGTATGTEIIE